VIINKHLNCFVQKENYPSRRQVTPPVGLNIPTQVEREQEAYARKRQYAVDLQKVCT